MNPDDGDDVDSCSFGPEDFPGSDEGSHYMSQDKIETKAKDWRVAELEAELEPEHGVQRQIEDAERIAKAWMGRDAGPTLTHDRKRVAGVLLHLLAMNEKLKKSHTANVNELLRAAGIIAELRAVVARQGNEIDGFKMAAASWQERAERLAERGGFCYWELIDQLGHEPKTWRPR